VSPIKCPSCEYRNFHPGDTCINCGALLSSQEATARPKKRPSPRSRSLSREEQILDSQPLAGEKPVARSRSLPREGRSPTNKPSSREERVAGNKIFSGEELSPGNRPLPRKKPSSSTAKPASEEALSSQNKPLSSEMSALEKKSLPRKEQISRNRSSSKIEENSKAKIDESYSEREPYPEDELSSKPEPRPTNDPYLADESYAEDESYDEDEAYPEDESYAEDGSYGSPSRQLILYHQNQLAKQANFSTALEPYQISADAQAYLPANLLPDLSTFVKEDKQARPKPWETDKLPWGLPRRDPDVEGTIIQIQQSQELPDYPNIVLGIVNMLTELIWLIPNDSMRREEERLQITTVRIRTSNDERRDVRLIGYLRGANLTLGDDVWFWGWHRQGSLTARKGYNWTSKAIISTHSMGLVVPALILLILMGIGFLLFLASPSIAAGLRILRIHP
jgi:hypothetical protein